MTRGLMRIMAQKLTETDSAHCSITTTSSIKLASRAHVVFCLYIDSTYTAIIDIYIKTFLTQQLFSQIGVLYLGLRKFLYYTFSYQPSKLPILSPA